MWKASHWMMTCPLCRRPTMIDHRWWSSGKRCRASGIRCKACQQLVEFAKYVMTETSAGRSTMRGLCGTIQVAEKQPAESH